MTLILTGATSEGGRFARPPSTRAREQRQIRKSRHYFGPMSEVDAADDGIERFVVQHYRSGADRKCRERAVVVAFDNEAEWESRLRVERLQLERRLAEGTADPWERIIGIEMQPGYAMRAVEKRQFFKSLKHGVLPAEVPQGVLHMVVVPDDEDEAESTQTR